MRISGKKANAEKLENLRVKTVSLISGMQGKIDNPLAKKTLFNGSFKPTVISKNKQTAVVIKEKPELLTLESDLRRLMANARSAMDHTTLDGIYREAKRVKKRIADVLPPGNGKLSRQAPLEEPLQ